MVSNLPDDLDTAQLQESVKAMLSKWTEEDAAHDSIAQELEVSQSALVARLASQPVSPASTPDRAS